jgi:hypothetical protein
MVEDEDSDRAGTHRWLGYESASAGRFIARCLCGWRSTAYPTAGLAGSAWDAHAATAEPPADA